MRVNRRRRPVASHGHGLRRVEIAAGSVATAAAAEAVGARPRPPRRISCRISCRRRCRRDWVEVGVEVRDGRRYRHRGVVACSVSVTVSVTETAAEAGPRRAAAPRAGARAPVEPAGRHGVRATDGKRDGVEAREGRNRFQSMAMAAENVTQKRLQRGF